MKRLARKSMFSELLVKNCRSAKEVEIPNHVIIIFFRNFKRPDDNFVNE